MSDYFVQVDLEAFVRSARQIEKRDWPEAVTNAFSRLADVSARGTRSMTSRKFEMHSDYITRGIKYYPQTETQKARAMQAIQRFGDMSAAVYLRGATDPKKSLEFMADHEYGESRHAKKKNIAIPTRTLKTKGYRTGRGRVRSRWKPDRLLKRFKESGSTFTGTTTFTKNKQRKKRLPGHAFIIQGKGGGSYIARRVKRQKSKQDRSVLEFLYLLIPRASIKREWGFAEQVWQEVLNNYARTITTSINKMPNYAK